MKQSIITQVQPNYQHQPPTINICLYIVSYIKMFLTCVFIRNLFKQRQDHVVIDVPKQSMANRGKKTLVIDLDETLVHSSFNYISDSDFMVKVQVMNINYTIYVRIRPGAESFLQQLAQYYEIFLFTASVPEYANPVIDKLDPKGVCALRLYRQNCTLVNGVYVKDLSALNRQLKDVIIIDNSASSFQLQPQNAIHIKNFIQDPSDTELLDLLPFLKVVSQFEDVRPVRDYLRKFNRYENISYVSITKDNKIYDRRQNSTYDDDEKVNESSIDTSKTDETTFLKQQLGLGLKTKFSLDEDDYASEIQYRDSQGLNSPNGKIHQDTNYDDENQL